MIARSLVSNLIALVVGLTLGEAIAQQQPAKIPVVGVLVTHAPLTDPVMESMRAGMRALGYEEGRNIKWDFVTAEGHLDRLPGLAEDLVRRKVDVILSPNELSARAAMKATGTIPIVMIAFGKDPVEAGLINSLSRPGGNVTGIYSLIADIQAKQLEMLKEAVPRLTRVAIFRDPSFKDRLDQITDAAKTLGLKAEVIEVRAAQDLEKAFKLAKQKKAGAILFMASPIFYVNRERVASLALAARVPGITGLSQLAEQGLLMSYGNDVDEIYRRTAYYVDRILKGTGPRDLPVEQVMTLTLTVNFKTAKALGVKFPESILVRVDKAIR